MKRRTIEVNQEFIICRYLNGIKLLSREDFKSVRRRDLFIQPIKPVSDLMQMPFSVFFIGNDCKVKDFNDFCCASHGIYSKSDVVGHTVARIANNQLEVTKLHMNNKHVMKTHQLSIMDERFDLSDNVSVQAVSFKMPWYAENGAIAGVFGCSVILHRDKVGCIGSDLATVSNMFLPSHSGAKNLLTNRAINGEYFTPREVDVIEWVVRGKTIREIGLILKLKTKTVEGYFADIKMKVGVSKKSELIEQMMLKTAGFYI